MIVTKRDSFDRNDTLLQIAVMHYHTSRDKSTVAINNPQTVHLILLFYLESL